MCGFGGIIGCPVVTIDQLADVARQVSNRGPDYTGLRIYDRAFVSVDRAGTVGIFHNRLAIIDLDARSNQPFEDERFVLVFNGEIYNFMELRNELTSLGYTFFTASDTEVLFVALKHWGAEAIGRFNGMFAFAFIDKQARTVLLARDRAGIKPLFYAWWGEALCFASDADSVIRFSGQRPQVDLQSAELYQVLQYVPGGRSIWSGIQSLLPGQFLMVDLDGTNYVRPTPVTYWNAYDEALTSQPVADLGKLLRKAVGRQLVADVPVGVFLSSGVDSSLLAAIITRHFPQAMPSFYTVGFDDSPENDESVSAKLFLEQLGAPSSSFTRLQINSKDLGDHWQQLYKVVDQPFGDHAILLNWAISRAAAKHVKVVLSGDGADEVFAGYDRYRSWAHYRRQHGSVPMIIRRVLATLSKRKGIAIRCESNPAVMYLLMLDTSGKSPEAMRDILSLCHFSADLAPLLLREDLPRLIDMKSYLPDAMLFKVDRASMAASIEVRVPFLDNEIIDVGLSEAAFFQGRPLKWQLRELLGQLAPHYDLLAPKKGFSFPLFRWMREHWSGLLQEIIYDGDLQAVGIEEAQIFPLMKSFQAGNDNVGYALWIQANLLLWHRTKSAQFGGKF